MKVMNSNFSFTVKVGAEHFSGHFNYHQNGSEVVKMSFRRLVKNQNDDAGEQVIYLRNLNGQWMLWDMLRKAPKYTHEEDKAVYGIFREAFGLALLNEA